MLSLSNTVNSSADVFSVVGIKCTIFVKQSYTTNIEPKPLANGSFTMKSIVMCTHNLSGTTFGISFPAGGSVQFLFL